MSETICVLDVHIDNCTVKQAMKNTVEYLGMEAVNVVELVTTEALLYAESHPEFREVIERSDLVLPGQKEILEAAEVTDGRKLRALEEQTYLKMVLRYLHRNHRRVYLLVESETEADELTGYFAARYRGIQIVGAAKVAGGPETDDMVMNAINGRDVDCVLATLPAPVQQEFIARNKSLMNARMWLGAGKAMEPMYCRRSGNRIMQFIERFFFKRVTRKNRSRMQAREGF